MIRGDLILKPAIDRGESLIKRRPNDSDGPTPLRNCSGVSCGVNAFGKAGDNDDALAHKFFRELGSPSNSVLRWFARTDDGNAGACP